MNAVRHYVSWLLALALLLGLCGGTRADTAIALSQTFNGAVNFTGTQVTIRSSSNNGNACSVYSSTTNRTATLSLPTGATVLSAQLYWAGSGNTADNTVTFQNKSVSAARKYSSTTVGNGMNYFGGAADVTDIVKEKGAGTYNFSGLTVSTGSPWCASEAVLGGFSLLVVYSHPNEAERILNLYEGFRYLQNSEFTLTATNFRWPSPWLPIREKARVGHITWEGDSTLLASGENLLFNGNELTDDMNPSGNQFNSKSNINRDSNSYGIDFDAYDTEVVQWIFYSPTVTTTYRTGQDLVILNAEILVVPTLPVSDLSISMTRGGSLQVGQTASYALTVKNNGPYTEAGPITVTDTLPAGMSYTGSSGSGWTCNANGQVVTCSYKTALAPNASAPALTINATVNQTGSLTNTATVAGTSDNNTSNNTATDTGTGTAAPVTNAGYVFTSSPCTPGATVGSSGCQLYSATMNGGGSTPATIYVTAVSGGKAVALNTLTETRVPMQFSLTCQNPAAAAASNPGKANYAGADLKECSRNGTAPSAADANAWSTSTSMSFAAGKASTAISQTNFTYGDVGAIQLNLLANGRVASSNTFTSRPTSLAFRTNSIVSADGIVNPGATAASGPGFAKAGEDFNAIVGAVLSDGSFASNFGNEATLPEVAVVSAPLPAVAALMPNAGTLGTSVPARATGGVALKLNYSDVGIINLTPSLSDYLATGAPVNGKTETVGRFFPSYYTTGIEPPFDCPAALNCDASLSGAAYSSQPFEVEVKAFNGRGEELPNYNQVAAWRRPVTLSAVVAPGKGAATAGALNNGVLASGAMEGLPNYQLTTPYSAAPGASTAWTAPTAVYIRATSAENLANGSTTVSSLRANPDDSVEDGIMIINGRLNVASVQGTNTQQTAVPIQAQYWDGKAWLNHTQSPDTVFAPSSTFTACRRDLKAAGKAEPASGDMTSTNCDAAIVRAGTPSTVSLSGGRGIYRLAAPGSGRAGSVWVEVDGPAWLPGTRGRVNFGATRSPMIYLREVY